ARRLPGLPWNLMSRVYLYREAGYPWTMPLTASALEFAASVISGLFLSASLLIVVPTSLSSSAIVGGVVLIIVLLAGLYPPALNRIILYIAHRSGTDPSALKTVSMKDVGIWIGTSLII